MQMLLNVHPDGSVSGNVVGNAPAPTVPAAPTDDAIEFKPSGPGPYQSTGRLTVGQLYYFDGASMPGYRCQVSVAVQPNYQAAIGETEGLERGAQMATTPAITFPEGKFRVYFKVVAGGPEPFTDCILNTTPTGL